MKLALERPSSPLPPRPTFPLGTAGTPRATDVTRPAYFVVLAVSLAFCVVTAERIVRVERDLKPALAQRAQLVSRMEASQRLLRDPRMGAAEVRLARADSVASGYHALATRAPLDSDLRTRLEGYTATFGAYYVAARRAAAGYSMSTEADGSSAEEARLGYTMLRENIAAGMAADKNALVTARAATAPVELAAWITVILMSAGALLRRPMPERTRRAGVASEQAPGGADDASDEDDGEQEIRLEDAVARMARKRLAAAIAAARVAQRNNERQIEISRTWHEPTISLVPPTTPPATPPDAPPTKPTAEMDVYVDDVMDAPGQYGRLVLVTA